MPQLINIQWNLIKIAIELNHVLENQSQTVKFVNTLRYKFLR